jgi:hypothetical protein
MQKNDLRDESLKSAPKIFAIFKFAGAPSNVKDIILTPVSFNILKHPFTKSAFWFAVNEFIKK